MRKTPKCKAESGAFATLSSTHIKSPLQMIKEREIYLLFRHHDLRELNKYLRLTDTSISEIFDSIYFKEIILFAFEKGHYSRLELFINAGLNVCLELAEEKTVLDHIFYGDTAELIKPTVTSLSATLSKADISTLLFKAVREEKPKILEELLKPEFGLDFEVRDPEGRTPLLLAIFMRNGPMISTLLSHGANIHAKMSGGISVLNLLTSPPYRGFYDRLKPEIISILTTRGTPLIDISM